MNRYILDIFEQHRKYCFFLSFFFWWHFVQIRIFNTHISFLFTGNQQIFRFNQFLIEERYSLERALTQINYSIPWQITPQSVNSWNNPQPTQPNTSVIEGAHIAPRGPTPPLPDSPSPIYVPSRSPSIETLPSRTPSPQNQHNHGGFDDNDDVSTIFFGDDVQEFINYDNVQRQQQQHHAPEPNPRNYYDAWDDYNTDVSDDDDGDNDEDPNGVNCGICMKNVFQRRPFAAPCGHLLCAKCISIWLVKMRKEKCPVCTQSLKYDQCLRLFSIWFFFSIKFFRVSKQSVSLNFFFFLLVYYFQK